MVVYVNCCLISIEEDSGRQCHLLFGKKEFSREGLDTRQGRQAKMCVDSDAAPHFCKAHTVPYSMRNDQWS